MRSGHGPLTGSGNSLMHRAQVLTAAGWRVFPWGIPSGKDRDQPLWSRYFGDAPVAATKLASPTWDRALGIGIACPSDVLGLDVDIKGEKHGDLHIATLQEELGPLPDGPFTLTKSGGQHRLYLRKAIPARARFRSHVGLHDGADADIDIVHGGYRYFKVYDDEFWLRLEHADIPEIPYGWHVALLRGPAGRTRSHRQPERPSPSRGTSDDVPMPVDVGSLLEQVRGADKNRNVTLNGCYFRAVLAGHSSDETRRRFQQAALESGLPVSEVEDTLDSAFGGAQNARAFINQWESAVAAMSRVLPPVRQRTLVRVAQVVVRTYLCAEDVEAVGLSCRELSERANLSRMSAARYLKHLCTMGLLARSGWRHEGEANRYRLRIPQHAHSGTVIHAHQERLSHYFTEGDAGSKRRMRLHEIVQHDAFARLGSGPVLPPTCAEILVALHDGEASSADLSRLLGRQAPTVRRSLRILQTCGLVDFATPRAKAHLLGDDVHAALDVWAQWMGADGRRARRRAVHVLERDAHAQQLLTQAETWARWRAKWPRLASREASLPAAKTPSANGSTQLVQSARHAPPGAGVVVPSKSVRRSA